MFPELAMVYFIFRENTQTSCRAPLTQYHSLAILHTIIPQHTSRIPRNTHSNISSMAHFSLAAFVSIVVLVCTSFASSEEQDVTTGLRKIAVDAIIQKLKDQINADLESDEFVMKTSLEFPTAGMLSEAEIKHVKYELRGLGDLEVNFCEEYDCLKIVWGDGCYKPIMMEDSNCRLLTVRWDFPLDNVYRIATDKTIEFLIEKLKVESDTAARNGDVEFRKELKHGAMIHEDYVKLIQSVFQDVAKIRYEAVDRCGAEDAKLLIMEFV